MPHRNKTIIGYWGGLRTIGGTIVTVEYNQSRVIFDFGTAFDPSDDNGGNDQPAGSRRQLLDAALRQKRLPSIHGIYAAGDLPPDSPLLPAEQWEGQTALLISHLHLDHCGAVGWTSPQVPVYLSWDSFELHRDLAVIGEGMEVREERLRPCAYDQRFPVGEILVAFVRVDHDIPGASGILIETPEGRIAYTGDLRLHGFHPEYTEGFLSVVRQWKPDVLIMEGTALRSEEELPEMELAPDRKLPEGLLSADRLEEELDEAIRSVPALAVVNLYHRDRERVLAMIRAARKNGRKAVLEPETAYLVEQHTLASDLLVLDLDFRRRGGSGSGILKHHGALPGWLAGLHAKYGSICMEEVQRSPGLFVLQNCYDRLFLLPSLNVRNGLYIHSNGAPLGSFDSEYAVLLDRLQGMGLPYKCIQMSGHAAPSQLSYMVDVMAPKLLVPLHSQFPERLRNRQGTVLLPEYGRAYSLTGQALEWSAYNWDKFTIRGESTDSERLLSAAVEPEDYGRDRSSVAEEQSLAPWWKDIRLIVLDLDGTLYRDEKFLYRYAAHLLEDIPYAPKVCALARNAEDILFGRHPVTPGVFYDPDYEMVLDYDGSTIRNIRTWEGGELDWSKQEELMDAIQSRRKQWICLGDEWGVMTALARRLRLSAERSNKAFLSVREEMLSHRGIPPYCPLAAALQALRPPWFRKLLVTNSPAASGFGFVAHLGVGRLLDSCIFDGGKPEALPDHLHAWMRREGLSFANVVSIGDNAWNDLRPIKQLGGRTVLISRYSYPQQSFWDMRVESLDELSRLLHRVAWQREAGIFAV